MVSSYVGPGRIVDGNSEYSRMKFVFEQLLDNVSTAIPAKVVSVSADGKRVDVQPMVNQLDGGGNAIPHGTVNGLLVWQYRAGVSAVLLAPAVGDCGRVVFCHSDISSVKASGEVANPGSLRKFDYSDGVYLGGLFGDEPEQYIRLSGVGIELVSPRVSTSGNFSVGTGATGSFTDAGGQVVTVVDGIITEIV